MVNMKLDAKAREKMAPSVASESDGPEYPYSLMLYLDDEVLMWWARVSLTDPAPTYGKQARKLYGRWIPTGCREQTVAQEYVRQFYPEVYVIEWLQL